jgi:hypothetical protein
MKVLTGVSCSYAVFSSLLFCCCISGICLPHRLLKLLHIDFLQVESNARFVKWKDGTMQLLIGNEVLDISVHEANHDQSHLFLRSGKVGCFFSAFAIWTALPVASLLICTEHHQQ